MLHLVLGAFGGAVLTRLDAELADLLGKFRAARKFMGGEGTEVGTGAIQADAMAEALGVDFFEAFGRTLVAGHGAVLARRDTFEELVGGHIPD